MKSATIQIMTLGLILIFQSVYADIDQPENNQPAATVMDAQYRFANVPEGEVVFHSFKIRNTGSGRLDILDVRPE